MNSLPLEAQTQGPGTTPSCRCCWTRPPSWRPGCPASPAACNPQQAQGERLTSRLSAPSIAPTWLEEASRSASCGPAACYSWRSWPVLRTPAPEPRLADAMRALSRAVASALGLQKRTCVPQDSLLNLDRSVRLLQGWHACGACMCCRSCSPLRVSPWPQAPQHPLQHTLPAWLWMQFDRRQLHVWAWLQHPVWVSRVTVLKMRLLSGFSARRPRQAIGAAECMDCSQAHLSICLCKAPREAGVVLSGMHLHASASSSSPR